MDIGFDAKRLFNNFTGLGNYSRYIVTALSDYRPHYNYQLYSPKIQNREEVVSVTKRNNIQVFSPNSWYRLFRLTSAWRTWGISKLKSVNRLDVFHGLSQELPVGLSSGIRKVVTVHDLIFIRYPQFYNPIDVAIYTAKVKAACSRADHVVAVSTQTASDLVTLLNINPKKISVVPQGCNPIFKRKSLPQEIATVKKKYRLPGQYMLTVGTIERRKNAVLLVKALALIPVAIRIPLVIVGKSTSYLDDVLACAKEKEVLPWIHVLHNASFQDFPEIYQGAEMFFFPSLFEGFGIPILEAIESGIPVITSNRAVFNETAGPDAFYINPEEPAEAAVAAVILMYDKQLRNAMVESAKKHITRFQPDVIAASLLEVYER